jgi:hypothetical protein
MIGGLGEPGAHAARGKATAITEMWPSLFVRFPPGEVWGMNGVFTRNGATVKGFS